MTLDEARKLSTDYAREQAAGCCGDDTWRGRFCQYHFGVEDGFFAGLLAAAPAETEENRGAE